MQSTTINSSTQRVESPLPEILEFLLTLAMSKASDLGRDDVREAARKAWLSLGTYMKQQAMTELELPEPLEVEQPPHRPNGASRTLAPSIRERFRPRARQMA